MEFVRLHYEVPSCSICFEECLAGLSALDCGHVFHRSCVVGWSEKEKKCPLCRKPIRIAPPELLFCVKKKEVDESARFSELFDVEDKVTLNKLLVH